jgi:hypothetical protein
MSIIFWNCSESNPSYVQNFYTNYWVEYHNLNPVNWVLSDSSDNLWNQRFSMSYKQNVNYGNIGIICFFKNRYNAWQAMPATGISKDLNGRFYKDELTFSNDSLNFFVLYRNPDLNNPSTIDTLQIKTVFFDGKYIDSLGLVKQIINENKKN